MFNTFMANYGKKLRIGADIRRKEKMEKVTEFTKKIKRIQEKAGAILKRIQEEMKR